jgi:CDP-diacylglycerol--serine O-phosphatidyltransferase
VVLLVALLIAYPRIVLTIGTVIYLASLPFGVVSYRNHERKAAAPVPAHPAAVPAEAASVRTASPTASPNQPPEQPADPDRPARLN